MKFFQFGLIFILLSLVGCGSDGRSSDIYYIQDRDVYLRVYDDGEVKKYRCSVNYGYQEDKNFTGILSENKMDVTWNEDSYSYVLSIDGSTSSYTLYEDFNSYGSLLGREPPDLPILLKEESVPTVCTNSAVDIVSLTPDKWDAALNNNIAVNFNYRGHIEGDLTIQLAYSRATPSLGAEVVYGVSQSIDGLSQSNLTLNIKSGLSSEDVLDIYVLMYETEKNDLISYGRTKTLNGNFNYDPSASLNNDCLTCEVGALNIGPFD